MWKMFSSRKNIEELLIDAITQCYIISQWWLWFLCDRTNFRLKSKQDFMPLWACNTNKLRKHLLEPCRSKAIQLFGCLALIHHSLVNAHKHTSWNTGNHYHWLNAGCKDSWNFSTIFLFVFPSTILGSIWILYPSETWQISYQAQRFC